jgi:hypothetical protein
LCLGFNLILSEKQRSLTKYSMLGPEQEKARFSIKYLCFDCSRIIKLIRILRGGQSIEDHRLKDFIFLQVSLFQFVIVIYFPLLNGPITTPTNEYIIGNEFVGICACAMRGFSSTKDNGQP